jgi:ribonuclease J
MSNLKITPLGGLKQIGSNMFLLEHNSKKAIIDCGILFPNDECFGLDYLIPDYTDLYDVEYLFITHGHEDHIGGIVHVIENFPRIKIFAPEFAAQLIQNKLERFHKTYKINQFNTNSILVFSDYEVHPIQINHSIPDTYGFLFINKIRSESLFYISDFKVDPLTHYEPYFDFKKLKALSSNLNCKALFADSTNILSKGKSPSESEILPVMEKIINNHQGRIFITLFASNIHRLQTIFNIAKKLKLPVSSYGRSLEIYIDTATQSNKLQTHNCYQQINKDPSVKQIILLTGCQGEFRGALKRVATGENPYYDPSPTDLFIFSSKVIPGNEKSVSFIYNKLSEQGCQIITHRDALVHVTGHAHQDDLQTVINEYQPTHYVPIHGESFFLRRHLDFVEKNNPQISTHFATNFDHIYLEGGRIRVEPQEDRFPILIQGKGVSIEKEKISQRRKMATQGLISIAINKKKLNFSIEFIGIAQIIEKNYQDSLQQIIQHYISQSKSGDWNRIIEQIRVELRRECNNILGNKPTVTIHLV